MRPCTVFLLILSLAAGCVPVGVSAQLGYTRASLDGRLALDDGTGSSTSSIEQDLGSAFGLGDGRDSPYVRAQVDLGAPVLTASLFWLRETGRGQLEDSFGGLVAGDGVATELDLAVGKISATYDLDLGFVKASPGLLFDVFSLDFSARELTLGAREVIDDVVFVPMPFLRLERGIGPLTAVGEVGYLEVSSIGDSGGSFLDLEAMLEYAVLPMGHVFVGYRFMDLDGKGTAGSDSYALDLQLSGLTIGGGLRF